MRVAVLERSGGRLVVKKYESFESAMQSPLYRAAVLTSKVKRSCSGWLQWSDYKEAKVSKKLRRHFQKLFQNVVQGEGVVK